MSTTKSFKEEKTLGMFTPFSFRFFGPLFDLYYAVFNFQLASDQFGPIHWTYG